MMPSPLKESMANHVNFFYAVSIYFLAKQKILQVYHPPYKLELYLGDFFN